MSGVPLARFSVYAATFGAALSHGWGHALEAHGGYLCRLADFDSAELLGLAREALIEEGEDPEDCSLLLSFLARPGVLRLAYDAPLTYGRKGARWYETHHCLARKVSATYPVTVHAYVLDPEELELVVGYGAGQRVGGEKVRYEDAELPDEIELDDSSFELLKERWPLGHLAKVLGIPREELLRIPRAPTVLLSLNGREEGGRLVDLFPGDRPRSGLVGRRAVRTAGLRGG